MSNDERKTRIRAGMLEQFAKSARLHFGSHPDTWSVAKAAERSWQIVDQSGVDHSARRWPTKRAAKEELGTGRHHRQWEENTAWLLGSSTDPRLRQLAADERDVVDSVLSELQPVVWTDGAGHRHVIEQASDGRFSDHCFNPLGFDLWGYDGAGKYSATHDRAPFQRSPFRPRDEV